MSKPSLEITTTVHPTAEELGLLLANASDDYQAEVLNVMAKEMQSWGSYLTQAQAQMMAAKLDRHGARLAIDLGEAAALEQGGAS